MRQYITMCLLAGSLAGSAQQMVPLSYRNYMEKVTEGNLEYAAERLNMDVSEAEVVASKVFNDPNLSVSYFNNENGSLQMGEGVEVELSKTFSFGKRGANIALARSESELTKALLADYFRNLRADATVSYLEALKQYELYKVKQNAYENIRQLAESDSVRFTLGKIMEIDATQSRLEAGILKNELLQAETDLHNAFSNLNLLTGSVSRDTLYIPEASLHLSSREQHIKREKATSNICTAQALLATMAGFYAVYHGAEGLRNIAGRIHASAGFLAAELEKLGYKQLNKDYFDTLKIELPANVSINALREIALECKVNLRYFEGGQVGISIDETTQPTDIGVLLYIFAGAAGKDYMLEEAIPEKTYFDPKFARTSDFLQEDVFKKYHTETELMRYITRLGRKDVSLAQSMISLGSCTMKLNAASEMLPLSRAEFMNIHPYAPEEQVEGYKELIENLCCYLAEITGFKGVTLQPNSGAAGEYTGLRVIRAYLESIGQGHRNIVLLPASAHGTNPASAIQCGYTTVTVKCDENGNIDLEDFRAKAEANKENLAASMITYPSTHGIFEADIKEMCDIVHACGGQLYMDGANMNAQVGLTNPGTIGADVCHLNLHKTFASPHGGGGPGVGPICVAEHLVPFLPSHPVAWGSDLNTVSAAPYGSAGILPITYAYIRMLGTEGLETVTKTAILNANYLASKFKDTYGIVYTGATGRVGHELILECRGVKEASGIDEGDIAKRLMDFGYHAPTLSFPVHGTLMVEPTESESKAELDRFAEVMDCIWKEIKEVEEGKASKEDNVLKNAPHPEYEVTADEWKHEYPRSKAAFPLEWLHDSKFWINVARVDNAYGDRNLIPTLCACEI